MNIGNSTLIYILVNNVYPEELDLYLGSICTDKSIPTAEISQLFHGVETSSVANTGSSILFNFGEKEIELDYDEVQKLKILLSLLDSISPELSETLYKFSKR